jgi:hypothetical protein
MQAVSGSGRGGVPHGMEGTPRNKETLLAIALARAIAIAKKTQSPPETETPSPSTPEATSRSARRVRSRRWRT